MPLPVMNKDLAGNERLSYALRTAQVVFAVVVMGTDGYAINMFRGHTELVHYQFGSFESYIGVPNAWGFLLFCASWTILTVFFQLIASIYFAKPVWVCYTRVAIEAVAVLSWLAGFIAVAAQMSANACSTGTGPCGRLIAATIFGALEWLLFMMTAALTFKIVFRGRHQSKASTTTSNSIV